METPRRDQFKEDESINIILKYFHEIHFYYTSGVILKDFAESGVCMNTEYYVNLVQQDRKLRRNSRVCDLYYLHDNAYIHTSDLATAAIPGYTLTELPSLSLCDNRPIKRPPIKRSDNRGLTVYMLRRKYYIIPE